MTDEARSKAFWEWWGSYPDQWLPEQKRMAEAAWDYQQKEIDALMHDVKRYIEISGELTEELEKLREQMVK